MKATLFAGMMTLLLAWLSPDTSHAQTDADIYWHIDPSVKSCSMVIDPSLTQSDWKRFTQQAGAILTFKALASAEPLGKGNFSAGIDYSSTPVNQHDPAWINTFTHPDADCPLGDQVQAPALRARLGVTSKLDVGAYWTTAPRANYGYVGGELRFAFLEESAKRPAAAAITSVTVLTGVSDFNFSVYSAGVMASKRISVVTPYAGVREGLSVGSETTSKVDLSTESNFFTQGFLGATYVTWKLGLAVEYDIAKVNTFAFAIGYHP